MARGSTLTALIAKVRIEIGASSDPAKGVNSRDVLVQTLNQEQNRLFNDFDWPFRSTFSDKLTAAGSRYYDVPATIDAERINKIHIKYNDLWYELIRGISLEDYNQYDSDDSDDRRDPAMKWEIYGAGQFEIWPLPATNNLTVRISGIQKLTKLVNGSDTAVLDDDLLVLFTAAGILRRKGKKDADLTLAKAENVFKTLKGRIHGRRRVTFATTSKTVAKKCQSAEWNESG